MTFLAAIGGTEDSHRKPSPLMWHVFCERLNAGVHIDMEASYYCGDSAGAVCKTRQAAQSDDEKMFACNIGLHFTTPENHFLGKPNRGSKYALLADNSSAEEEASSDSGDGWDEE